MEYRKGLPLYDIKYDLVFYTKYHYRILKNQITNRAREVCTKKYIDIIRGSMSIDHTHLLILILPSVAVSKIVQYIKGESS